MVRNAAPIGEAEGCKMDDRLRTCIDALRVLARSNDPIAQCWLNDTSTNISGPTRRFEPAL